MKKTKNLGKLKYLGGQVQHCRLHFVSVGHRLACNTIANLSGGQLGWNVGIVSIPPDTYSAAATFVSFVSQRLLWPSLLCLSRNTICRDHPPHIYPDHPVASWPHSPYQPLINGWMVCHGNCHQHQRSKVEQYRDAKSIWIRHRCQFGHNKLAPGLHRIWVLLICDKTLQNIKRNISKALVSLSHLFLHTAIC